MATVSIPSIRLTKLDTGMRDITMSTTTGENPFIGHEPCEVCGSRDNKGRYADGTAFCFGCQTYFRADDEGEIPVLQDRKLDRQRGATVFLQGEIHGLPKRNLTEDTCRFWNYQVASEGYGEPCHIANYYDADKQLLAQKVRKAGKQFSIIGDGKDLPLYGKWLWFGKSTKSIVITEGEIDALSVSQAFDHKYPVVSLPNGAQTASKVIRREYEWLSTFEKIVLMFDSDTPGKEAVEAVAALLPIGKVLVAHLDAKDANDALIRFGPQVLVKAYWNAVPWRPDGIVQASDLRESVLHPVQLPSIPYPWEGLNEKLGGLRPYEIVTITAGSGCGKTTLVKEIAYDLLVNHGQAVGMLMLEENNTRTMEGLISIALSKNIVINRGVVTEEEIANAFDTITGHNLFLYNHFGSGSVDSILDRIRYLVRGCGVHWVFLDHLSILISGLDVGDERKQIDIAMTRLRTLVEELGCGLVIVSHLRRPEGDKGHEDGATVRLGQLRGSHAIAQLSDIVVGVQRHDDPNLADAIELIVLKNRWSGDRGSGGLLTYDRQTGRLTGQTYF
jgi:twinkle protein